MLQISGVRHLYTGVVHTSDFLSHLCKPDWILLWLRNWLLRFRIVRLWHKGDDISGGLFIHGVVCFG